MALQAAPSGRRGAGRPPESRGASAHPRDPAADVARLLADDGPRPALPPAAIAGIEQEYGVLVDGRQVEFGDLIDQVAPPGSLRRFAFDNRARIVRSGAIWTVDAPHAEVATPPRPLRPGIASRLADDALAEREALRRRLRSVVPGRVELRGYSTHLNAFADDVDGWDLVWRVAVTYAPALMLLAERRGSPGLLVRPRPRRLEIGTEYLETREDLVAASVVTLAVAIAAWRECRGEPVDALAAPAAPAAPSAPAALDGTRLLSPWQRPGWFVPLFHCGARLGGNGRRRASRHAGGLHR